MSMDITCKGQEALSAEILFFTAGMFHGFKCVSVHCRNTDCLEVEVLVGSV